MAKYDAGVIHPTARYRTQTSAGPRGIYNTKEQYLHHSAGNWEFPGWPHDNGERVVVNIILDSTSDDDDSAYTVYTHSFDDAAALNSKGRIYFAIKCTASTVYYNDFAIGGVQLLSDDFSTLDFGWAFSDAADFTDWESPDVVGMNTTGKGYENYADISGANPENSDWNNLIDSVANGRISRNSATTSTFTGPADGISAGYSDNGLTPLLMQEATDIDQESGNEFMYTEGSGSSANMQNKWWWMRSPQVTLNGEGDKDIAIAYHAATHHTSGGKMEDAEGDELFRWWWIAG